MVGDLYKCESYILSRYNIAQTLHLPGYTVQWEKTTMN